MALSSEKTGKTVEEAKRAAILELGVAEERTVTEILEEPSKGFLGIIGAKPARVRVTIKDDAEPPIAEDAPPPASAEPDAEGREAEQYIEPAVSYTDSVRTPEDVKRALDRAEDFLKKIFEVMRLEVTIRRSSTEDAQVLSLAGEELGILIGKHGQTLDSLQYLTNLAANRGVLENRTRIIIDIEHYRERREETLRRLAARLAEKVVRTRQKVILEPMNRHERKIIHMALQGNHRVSTYSAGDEPFRKVVIEPYRERRRYRQNPDYAPSGDYSRPGYRSGYGRDDYDRDGYGRGDAYRRGADSYRDDDYRRSDEYERGEDAY